MAKEPTVVPFAQGAPADNLEVEELNEDEVLIGDKSLDNVVDVVSEHDSNLAEEIEENYELGLTDNEEDKVIPGFEYQPEFPSIEYTPTTQN